MAYRIANTVVIGSAIGIVLVALQQTTHVLPGSKRVFALERERCYGIVRAGSNDCGTARHACAGQARGDAGPDEWLMLPAGTCLKIAGGEGKPDAW